MTNLGESSESNPEREVIEPEVIVEGDGPHAGGGSAYGQQSSGAGQAHWSEIQSIRDLKVPWILRVVLLMVAILTGFWFVVACIAAVMALALDLITFNRIPACRNVMHSAWRMVPRSAVVTIALAVAAFSPPLGVGFVTLYWMFYEDDPEAVSRMHARFTRYQR